MNWALRCGPYVVLIIVALVALVAVVMLVARVHPNNFFISITVALYGLCNNHSLTRDTITSAAQLKRMLYLITQDS
jgi:high-affinity nickel permease